MESAYQLSAADASADARAEFLAKTYAHLAGAVFAFVALEAVLVNTGFGISLAISMSQSWFIVLGLFIFAGWIANKWAHSGQSTTMQYAGLGLYVVAEALIFLPLMAYASMFRPDAIAPAAVLTLMVFGGLTAYVFITKANFNWLGGGLAIFGCVAMGLIVCAMLFKGLTLGTWFAALLVLFAGACILFSTSKIMREYPVGGHVGASLSLFASLALMFYYIMWIFMAGDD